MHRFGVQRIMFMVGAVALGVVALARCGSQKQEPSAPRLLVFASPTTLVPNGNTSDISVIASDTGDVPGTGTVSIAAPKGTLDGTPNQVTVSLASGRASVKYACDAALDKACTGKQTITAQWNSLTVTTIIDLAVPGTAGGTDGGAGGGTDGGADGGTTSATAGPLSLSSSKATVFMGVGDYADITASLATTDGGVMPGESVAFSATIDGTPTGNFADTDGGVPATVDGGYPVNTLSATTGANGKAVVRFRETGLSGLAKIAATHTTSNSTATLDLAISAVQQISWDSTKCNGADCTIMGLKGSGFNEQAQVTFKVVDSGSKPVPRTKVTFSIPNPLGTPNNTTTVTPQGLTDDKGLVTANVSSGDTIGVFNVHAVVIPGRVETDSQTIGIRGAKPSNQGFFFQCLPVNIGAYVSPVPPAAYQVTCTVKLVDRFNNSIGTGTSVNFKVEVGSITPTVSTKKFDPAGTNGGEGTASVTFDTQGKFPATDVAPLAADPAQFPYPRAAEPSVTVGSLVRNPRDGLVTILAYTQGEEYFQDNNNNGVWDPGEMFIDQGEPFVDWNDNGVCDGDEPYLDQAPLNGKWDGPNTTWDRNTTVWAEARILFTGRPSPVNSYTLPSPFALACPGGLAKGSFLFLNAFFLDQNLNVPQASGTTFSVSNNGGKGTASWQTLSYQDGYGFDWERRLVDAATLGDCNSSPLPARCIWKPLFYDWKQPAGSAKMAGADLTDTTPCQNETLSIDATVLGGKTTIFGTGGVQ